MPWRWHGHHPIHPGKCHSRRSSSFRALLRPEWWHWRWWEVRRGHLPVLLVSRMVVGRLMQPHARRSVNSAPPVDFSHVSTTPRCVGWWEILWRWWMNLIPGPQVAPRSVAQESALIQGCLRNCINRLTHLDAEDTNEKTLADIVLRLGTGCVSPMSLTSVVFPCCVHGFFHFMWRRKLCRKLVHQDRGQTLGLAGTQIQSRMWHSRWFAVQGWNCGLSGGQLARCRYNNGYILQPWERAAWSCHPCLLAFAWADSAACRTRQQAASTSGPRMAACAAC